MGGFFVFDSTDLECVARLGPTFFHVRSNYYMVAVNISHSIASDHFATFLLEDKHGRTVIVFYEDIPLFSQNKGGYLFVGAIGARSCDCVFTVGFQ